MSDHTHDEKQHKLDFLFSMRGQLILGQALTEALDVMGRREPPQLREHSNMSDINYILDEFPTMKSLGAIKNIVMEGEERSYRVVTSEDRLVVEYDYTTINGIVATEVAKSHTDQGMECKAVLRHTPYGGGKTYEIVIYPRDEEE
tara:strand:+ start:1253 stop:1687 length:435 start_codon:yes stop_codon:yes gene_type:complete